MAKNGNKPWKDAIVEVLKTANKPMHYADIAAEIQKQGLRTKVGATPASSVNVVIHESIKKDAAESPFVKVGTGEFILKATLPQAHPAPADQTQAATNEAA